MTGYNSLNYCGAAKIFVSFASPVNGLLPAKLERPGGQVKKRLTDKSMVQDAPCTANRCTRKLHAIKECPTIVTRPHPTELCCPFHMLPKTAEFSM
jgi:hypothetical protein